MASLSDYRNILINGIKLEKTRELDAAKKLYIMAIQDAAKAECDVDALELFYGDRVYDFNELNYAQALDIISVAICAADLCDLVYHKLPAATPGGWAVVGIDVVLNSSTNDVADFFRFLMENEANVSLEDITKFNKVKNALKKGQIPFKMRSQYLKRDLMEIIKGLVNNDIEIRENELV